ncbi:hypothetical protein GGQ73_003281 [Rhizobium skierniewicense]|uniref:Uncharacterized protein n=1 Tax=Rhizobium skierniewicense TaxID=984260 RepID=A0A7W6G2Z5_9HYPH|nr:hypothetical protein [Rhizobium skierniewicense]MBB3947315.1 hypothetical protein [Rhizobium skierniewicense]
MNIDNNIGGSAHHPRSQHIEKRSTETVAPEHQQATRSGSKISFVNALEATSLANVLWTVNNEAAANDAASQSSAAQPMSQVESVWLRQAYTEH